MSEKENSPARTYKDSGVDLDAADRAKGEIKRLVRRTFNKNVLTDVGLFGGLFKFDKNDFKSPVLVSSVDGVGTKLKIAFITGRHSTVGQCLVNHCVNDILAQGAKPLFFLDYIASGRLFPETVASIVEGLAIACEENGCALIGGETAEMPAFYKDGEYDLAGFIIGVVEQDRIINGSEIRENDIIIGLSSSGMHTNGYSLARKIIFDDLKLNMDDHIPEFGRTVSDELLQVHRSYLTPVSRLLEKNLVSGIAHITGGGFEGNISRVMPDGLTAEVDTETWEPLPIFRFIQKNGRVAPEEMYRVFNMGIGMVILMKREALGETEVLLKKAGGDFKVIGRVIKGEKPVRLLGI